MSLTFFLVFGVLPLISSTRGASTCFLDGVDIGAGSHELTKPINDTYRGILEVFQMKNVQRVIPKGDSYFKVTLNDTTLTFATGDNFPQYEAEAEPSTNTLVISVALELQCTESNNNHMIFTQRVLDTNNHAPQLDQSNFEYAFGPSIPKDFILTDLLPIKATDGDITNKQLNFEMTQNEFFKIEKTVPRYTKKEYAPKLTALKEIPAPFSQEFELNVTDSGDPPLKTRALITVRVLKPSDIVNQNISEAHHPPVFGKNFYMAYYNKSHQIEMEDVITIRYGLTNTTAVNITKHYQYFNATLKNETVTVRAIKELPQEIILEGFVVVELESLNEGVSSPGRTALLIEFSDMMISSECHIFIFGYSMGYPTVLFSSAILAILLINVCILAIFFNKQRKPTFEKY